MASLIKLLGRQTAHRAFISPHLHHRAVSTGPSESCYFKPASPVAASPARQSRRALSRVTASSSLLSFHRSRAPYRRFSWPVAIESLPLSSRMSRSPVRHSRVPCRQSQITASASVRRGVPGERGTVSRAERPDHRNVPGWSDATFTTQDLAIPGK
jgi:hypothetical protein